MKKHILLKLSLIILLCILTIKPCLSDEEFVEPDNAGTEPKQGTQKVEEKKPIKEIKKLGNVDNGYLLIVNVYKEDNNIKVVFKTTRKLSRATRDKAKICIDFFDIKNLPIGGESKIVEEYKILAPEETGAVYFNLPHDAENYQVWLPDFK
ncbi:MAG: hypothetical protein HQK91_06315 [Nitrospirae bacterium]|nr:hypothetical protein [Nitrospirota bacterium]MBF0541046.1 hypothetical protein [Nitrospirota bacterium]